MTLQEKCISDLSKVAQNRKRLAYSSFCWHAILTYPQKRLTHDINYFQFTVSNRNYRNLPINVTFFKVLKDFPLQY